MARLTNEDWQKLFDEDTRPKTEQDVKEQLASEIRHWGGKVDTKSSLKDVKKVYFKWKRKVAKEGLDSVLYQKDPHNYIKRGSKKNLLGGREILEIGVKSGGSIKKRKKSSGKQYASGGRVAKYKD
jgi:hypothetical protein